MWENWQVTPPQNNTRVTVELGEIVKSGVNVWDFEYPSFYTGSEKKAFEQKVIDHFYFRQIGQETVGRFLHYFRARIREIMPYYVQRYKSEKWLWDNENPLESYNLTEEYTETRANESEYSNTGTGTNKGNHSNTQNNVYNTGDSGTTAREHSDTPQGAIENINNYLTDFTRETVNTAHTGTDEFNTIATVNDTTTSENSGESSDNGTVTHKLTRRGNIGVQTMGKEINEIRAAFLNIDMEIINELNDLFLMVY